MLRFRFAPAKLGAKFLLVWFHAGTLRRPDQQKDDESRCPAGNWIGGKRMTTFQDGGERRGFVDRRRSASAGPPGVERRQFANTYTGLSADARELAEAIDGYKMRHGRRYITFEEMLRVIQELGYAKHPATADRP